MLYTIQPIRHVGVATKKIRCKFILFLFICITQTHKRKNMYHVYNLAYHHQKKKYIDLVILVFNKA